MAVEDFNLSDSITTDQSISSMEKLVTDSISWDQVHLTKGIEKF